MNDLRLESSEPEVPLGPNDERTAAFGLVLPLEVQKMPLSSDRSPVAVPVAPGREKRVVIPASLVITAQLFLLFLTATGWGFWFWKLGGLDRHPVRLAWLLCGLVGLVSNTLFLQTLVYLDARLQWTAWIGLIVALSGCIALCHHWRAAGRTGAYTFERPSDAKLYAIVLGVIFLTQGAALFYHGPANYYGWGHVDQVNYVYSAQFLIDAPFSTRLEDVGLHPWLTRAIDFKNYRIGQNVTLGYLAVVSLSDAKAAYGAVTLFLLAMLGVTTFAILRVLSAPRITALLGSLWVSCLPGITKIHLDGFLSQISVMMVFPALALAFVAARLRPFLLLAFNVILLAYLFCCYAEVVVFGYGMSALLWLTSQQYSWRRRAGFLAMSVLGSLLIVPSATSRLLPFIASQYRTAAVEPFALYSLVPSSGTWLGWAQPYWGYHAATTSIGYRMEILMGFVVLMFCLAAFFSQSPAKKIFLFCLSAFPIAALVHLLATQVFPKYAFTKLIDTFLPIWGILAVLGTLRFQTLIRSVSKCWPRWGANALLGCFFLVGVHGTGVEQWEVIHNKGSLDNLRRINSPVARKMYSFVEQNPNEAFLIADTNYLTDIWLAYHARKSAVYLDPGQLEIGGESLPVDNYLFHRVASSPSGVWLLKNGVFQLNAGVSGGTAAAGGYLPTLIVRNSQGAERDGDAVSYWIGNSVRMEIIRDELSPPLASYLLIFEATAGPANPDRRRVLRLVDEKGRVEERNFVASERISFPVEVSSGVNRFRLEVVEPREQLVNVPGDPRNLMLRVSQPRLEAPGNP